MKITEEERILVMEKIAYDFAIPEKDGLKPDIYKIKLEFISACVEYQKILKIQLFQKSDIIKEFPKLLDFPPRLLRSDTYRPYAIRSVIDCLKENHIPVIPKKGPNLTIMELYSELCSGHVDISWYDQINQNQKESMIESVCDYCCITAGMINTGLKLILRGLTTYKVTHEGDVGSRIRIRSLMKCQQLLHCLKGVLDYRIIPHPMTQRDDSIPVKSPIPSLNHMRVMKDSLGMAIVSSTQLTYFPFTVGHLIFSDQSQSIEPISCLANSNSQSLNESTLSLLTIITHSLLSVLSEQNSAVRMRTAETLFILADPLFTQSSFISAVIQAFPPSITNPINYSQTAIIDAVFDNLCNSIFIHDFCKGLVFLVGGITPVISDYARHKLVSILSTEIGVKMVIPEFIIILCQSVDNKRNELIAALKTVIVCLSCTSELSSNLYRTLCEVCLSLCTRYVRNRVVMTNVSELVNLVGDGFPIEMRSKVLNYLLQSPFENVRENANEFKLIILNEYIVCS